MFKIGTLVRLDYGRDIHWVGVVVNTDNDYKYGRIYYVAFTDGDTEWCMHEDLEEVCKQDQQLNGSIVETSYLSW